MQNRDDELQREDAAAEAFAVWVRKQLELLAAVPTSAEVDGRRPDRDATIM